MNKALREAHVLFKIPYEKIQVVIHPQSIIHSAVSFVDGNIICQMGANNMEILSIRPRFSMKKISNR